MKAFAYVDKVALDTLQLVTRPDPDPGPHDVVIRIRAAALNYRDLAIARGNYHIGVRAPLIPLSDGAGDVVAIGSVTNPGGRSGVSGLSAGLDRRPDQSTARPPPAWRSERRRALGVCAPP